MEHGASLRSYLNLLVIDVRVLRGLSGRHLTAPRYVGTMSGQYSGLPAGARELVALPGPDLLAGLTAIRERPEIQIINVPLVVLNGGRDRHMEESPEVAALRRGTAGAGGRFSAR